jgi:cysteinylglycine-S-conjugate dipeptidase
MRISPAESPESGLDALKKHLRDHVPFGAKLEFGDVELGPGYQAISGWASRVSKQTMAAAWEKEPVEYGVGGSIPFISKFAELFPKAQILVTGVEEPDSRAHSPNESQHLPTLRHAMEAEALLLLHGNSLRRNMA